MALVKNGFNFIRDFIISLGGSSIGFAFAWLGLFVFLVSTLFRLGKSKKTY